MGTWVTQRPSCCLHRWPRVTYHAVGVYGAGQRFLRRRLDHREALLFFLLVPLAIGVAIQFRSASVASRLEPIVKKVTGIDTLLMLGLCVVIYGKAFLGLVGSYAIGVQILFYSVAAVVPYLLSFGLPQGQKIVLSLGMGTRNIGAALAPLFAVPDVDQRAIVMVAFGVLMQAIFSISAASYFGRRAKIAEPGAAQTATATGGPRK